jgi:hypothetical protein
MDELGRRRFGACPAGKQHEGAKKKENWARRARAELANGASGGRGIEGGSAAAQRSRKTAAAPAAAAARAAPEAMAIASA